MPYRCHQNICHQKCVKKHVTRSYIQSEASKGKIIVIYLLLPISKLFEQQLFKGQFNLK